MSYVKIEVSLYNNLIKKIAAIYGDDITAKMINEHVGVFINAFNEDKKEFYLIPLNWIMSYHVK